MKKAMSYSQNVNAGNRPLTDKQKLTGDEAEFPTQDGKTKKKRKRQPDVFENTPPIIGQP